MSAAPQRKQPASEGDGGQLAPAQLMRDMGSTKGFDPIPPDQYLTLRDKRYPPEQRLLWWMASKTIRHGHRSPYAVDEHGKELWLKHAATELNVDQANLRRAWRELEAEGRVRTEGRRLYLNGTVTLPAFEAKEKRSEVCTNLLLPYYMKQIKQFSPERQKAVLTEYAQETAVEAKTLAEAVAGVRSIFDQRKDNILSRFGVKKIRGRKRREAESLLVPVLAEFIERSVQTRASPAVRVCTTPKNGHVQTSASLCVSETEKSFTAAAALSLVEGGRNGHAEEHAAAAAASSPTPETEPQSPDPVDPDPWNEPSLLPWSQTIAAMRERFPALGYAAAEKLAALVEATDAEIACAVRLINQRRKFSSEGIYFKAARDFIVEARNLIAAEEADRVRTERHNREIDEATQRADEEFNSPAYRAQRVEQMRKFLREKSKQLTRAQRNAFLIEFPELAEEFGAGKDQP